MKFITPCFVRVENSDARKELTEWLKGIGYHVCSCCLFDGWNTLHCDLIERLEAHYEVHGIPDYDKDTGYNVGWFKADNADKVHPSYDCGENIALFKALAAMNDENDYQQYFRHNDNKYRWLLCNTMRLFDAVALEWNWHKATAEEIVEYFKNNEK